MKTIDREQFVALYFKLVNRELDFVFKDGKQLKGIIDGYFRDQDQNEIIALSVREIDGSIYMPEAALYSLKIADLNYVIVNLGDGNEKIRLSE